MDPLRKYNQIDMLKTISFAFTTTHVQKNFKGIVI